ncbi:MAG: arylsulfotransferase family protein [Acidimicrobiales bacterium]
MARRRQSQAEVPGDRGPLLARRQALGLGMATAAAISLGRCSLARGAFAEPISTSSARRSALPKLDSSATVVTGNIQRYLSRPDLAPPAVHVDIHRQGQDTGLVFVDSHSGPSDQGPMIIDGSGELVWFKKVSRGPRSTRRAFNLRAQWWQGKPVLTWFDGNVVASHGKGEDVIASPSYTEIARVRAGDGYSDDLHVFLLTHEGTAIVSSFGLAYADLAPYGGGANAPYLYGVAQEIDISSGRVLFDWHSDEHVSLDESYAPLAFYRSHPWDYFHINSISVARDGNLLISSRNTWTVYKVERSTGQVLWRLGGKKSDFKFGRGAHFSWQHDVNEQPDGTFTVFDNGIGDYKSEAQSRALVLRVDDVARRVNLEHQYVHPRSPLLAGALGSVQVLPGGHVFVGWGAEGAFTEYGPGGRALLDGRLDGEGVQSYRAFRQDWVGFPAGPPDVAVERGAKAMTLYVSWNGATQVTEWLVLGGKHPSALGALGTAYRQGFETIIRVPQRTAYVAVAGLDARGKQLGGSKAQAT